jgi:hypothetical protein
MSTAAHHHLNHRSPTDSSVIEQRSQPRATWPAADQSDTVKILSFDIAMNQRRIPAALCQPSTILG